MEGSGTRLTEGLGMGCWNEDGQEGENQKDGQREEEGATKGRK